ncbi:MULTISPECIES: hypothetical protein [unclassified Sphingomonas]|uniref:hypothetical protein n=1 Tax=unclassified Sphingomonas TaxID=196159 RepID=UPI00226A8666|nr:MULTISPECIES: hypothetical protein [unclassified Sphingomonas]
MAYNAGYPLAAAFFGIGACGFILDIGRMLVGRPHPLILQFALATLITGALFALALRRLARSFRGGR